MATTATTRAQKVTRRVMVRVPVCVGTFLDLVCKYGGVTKGTLIKTIFAAGIKEVFGHTMEDIEQCSLTVPRLVYPGDVDFKELANDVCRGR